MVNTGLQVIGFIVGLLGFITSVLTTFLPAWQKSDIRGEVIESIRRYNGLWTRCTAQATGIWACDAYDSFFLGLPVALQGARACACVSMVLGLAGVVLSALGLKCANFASDNPTLKARIVIVAGVLHVLAGAVIGGAVSWFAANILQDYYNIAIPRDLKYVYGEALFVGWASMAISIISGLILCCSSWNSDEDDNLRGYTYNPPKPKPSGTEYI